MSAARRSSCSSSSRRYSHSSTRDRHSHSRCCSTAEGHGIEVIYLLGTKLLKIGQLEKSKIYRPAKGGIKREGAASLWSALPLSFFANRALRSPLYATSSSNTHSPLKASRTPQYELENVPALFAFAYARPPYAYALLPDRRGTRLCPAEYQ